MLEFMFIIIEWAISSNLHIWIVNQDGLGMKQPESKQTDMQMNIIAFIALVQLLSTG